MHRNALRIAVVSTSYPSHPDDPAGHFVRTHALALHAQGHQVHIIAPRCEGYKSNKNVSDYSGLANDRRMKLWPVCHAGAFGWPGAIQRLRSNPLRWAGVVEFTALAVARLRQIGPDRIVAHWMVPCGFPIATGANIGASLHLIAHGSDVRLLVAMPAPVREAILRQLLRHEIRFQLVAHACFENLLRKLPRDLRDEFKQRAFVQACEIAVPDVTENAVKIRQQCKQPHLVISVARLVKSKRVDLAIDALRLCKNTQLCVLGDGPDKQRLMRRCGGADVRFLGSLCRQNALAWIAAANVVVHTSMHEAAPTVVREARMLGVPVVACRAGDIERWAKRDTGIICVNPEAEQIAEGIDKALLMSRQRQRHLS